MCPLLDRYRLSVCDRNSGAERFTRFKMFKGCMNLQVKEFDSNDDGWLN